MVNVEFISLLPALSKGPSGLHGRDAFESSLVCILLGDLSWGSSSKVEQSEAGNSDKVRLWVRVPPAPFRCARSSGGMRARHSLRSVVDISRVALMSEGISLVRLASLGWLVKFGNMCGVKSIRTFQCEDRL